MTNPGSGGDWPHPQGQPGGWPPNGPQPGYPQQDPNTGQYPGQRYGAPQYGQPQYGSPQTGGQYPGQYGQQPTAQYTTQYTGQVPPGAYGPPPGGYGPQPPRRHTGRVIGIVVAVVVLAGGGTGAWFAFNHASASAGSSTPEAATAKLVSDLNKGDVLGLVNDLPPGESSLVRDEMAASTDALKRMQVVRPDADPNSSMSAAKINATGLTFDTAHAVNVTPNVTVTKLTGGTISLTNDYNRSAYTDQFLHSAFPNGLPQAKTQTVNVADILSQTGQPVRIATVQVNGSWYPSLFYSIADAALQASHQSWPTRSVPNIGEASADAAARTFVQSLLDANVTRAIELLSPDEMAVLHDVGQNIVDSARGASASGVKIDDMQFSDRQVTGGTDTVLTSITIDHQGDRITVRRDGSCYSATHSATNQTKKVCGSDILQQIQQGSNGFLPPEAATMLQHLASGLLDNGVGLVASQSGGQWYIAPFRSVGQVVIDIMSKLQPSDIAALAKLGQQFGH